MFILYSYVHSSEMPANLSNEIPPAVKKISKMFLSHKKTKKQKNRGILQLAEETHILSERNVCRKGISCDPKS